MLLYVAHVLGPLGVLFLGIYLGEMRILNKDRRANIVHVTGPANVWFFTGSVFVGAAIVAAVLSTVIPFQPEGVARWYQ